MARTVCSVKCQPRIRAGIKVPASSAMGVLFSNDWELVLITNWFVSLNLIGGRLVNLQQTLGFCHFNFGGERSDIEISPSLVLCPPLLYYGVFLFYQVVLYGTDYCHLLFFRFPGVILADVDHYTHIAIALTKCNMFCSRIWAEIALEYIS